MNNGKVGGLVQTGSKDGHPVSEHGLGWRGRGKREEGLFWEGLASLTCDRDAGRCKKAARTGEGCVWQRTGPNEQRLRRRRGGHCGTLPDDDPAPRAGACGCLWVLVGGQRWGGGIDAGERGQGGGREASGMATVDMPTLIVACMERLRDGLESD